MKLSDAAEYFKKGGIGVIPTDTLYGLVGKASDEKAVERIYLLKGRDSGKPLIVLLGDVRDLELFHAKLGSSAKNFLAAHWPGPLSAIVSVAGNEFEYLHRGTQSIAFRIPDNAELRELIRETGPLVAPSANPQGETPAATLEEAKKYFGGSVDLYIDGGMLAGEPSTLVDLTRDEVKILRQGVYDLNLPKA